MVRHRKSEFQIGMEHILNNPQTSFLKNPQIFNGIQQESKMPLTQMIRFIGKTKKGKKSEPTEKEQIEQRLNNLAVKLNH